MAEHPYDVDTTESADGSTPVGVHNEAGHAGPALQTSVRAPGGRRRRRGFGAIDQLRSGRFRARFIGPEGRYVAAPSTFASRTDAALWLDVQRADLVRGLC